MVKSSRRIFVGILFSIIATTGFSQKMNYSYKSDSTVVMEEGNDNILYIPVKSSIFFTQKNDSSILYIKAGIKTIGVYSKGPISAKEIDDDGCIMILHDSYDVISNITLPLGLVFDTKGNLKVVNFKTQTGYLFFLIKQ